MLLLPSLELLKGRKPANTESTSSLVGFLDRYCCAVFKTKSISESKAFGSKLGSSTKVSVVPIKALSCHGTTKGHVHQMF